MADDVGVTAQASAEFYFCKRRRRTSMSRQLPTVHLPYSMLFGTVFGQAAATGQPGHGNADIPARLSWFRRLRRNRG
jgi:hypothetical protein